MSHPISKFHVHAVARASSGSAVPQRRRAFRPRAAPRRAADLRDSANAETLLASYRRTSAPFDRLTPPVTVASSSRIRRTEISVYHRFPPALCRVQNACFAPRQYISQYTCVSGTLSAQRILFLHQQLKTNNRLLFFNRLAARPPNSQLAQFFLQALPVQANRRRRAAKHSSDDSASCFVK